MRNSERGFVLIGAYLLLAVIVVLAGAVMAHALADIRSSQREQAGLQAYYVAEAGVDQALVQLRQNYNWLTGYSGLPVGSLGAVTVEVAALPNDRRLLTVQGQSQGLATPVQRWIEAIVQKQIPPGFYDNAVWSSQSLELNGNSYAIQGNVRHGDATPPSSTGGITGTVTYDPATNPLPRLSFQQLYDIAVSQGNVYDAARLAGGPAVFPDSFWFTPPTDPNDPSTGVPNVNYVTTDLVLNGNVGSVGGFFVVVGNVLTDPGAIEDTTINGVGQVDGIIYTTGDFRVNGGGGGLNVNGGVWAGDETRLNGNVTLSYNADYMDAIEALGINADVQIVSWRDF